MMTLSSAGRSSGKEAERAGLSSTTVSTLRKLKEPRFTSS